MPRKKSVLTSFIPHKHCIESSCGGFGLMPTSGDLRPGMDLLPDTVMACDNTRSAFNIYLTEDVEVVRFHGKDHLVVSRTGDKEMLERVKEIGCLVVILQLLNGNPMVVRVLGHFVAGCPKGKRLFNEWQVCNLSSTYLIVGVHHDGPWHHQHPPQNW